MSDLMKWPGARDKGKSNKPDNSWLKFVTDPHLELLMELVDQQRRGQRLSKEDSHYYITIKEQAEAFITQAAAERWTEADKRARMLAWDDAYIVVKR